MVKKNSSFYDLNGKSVFITGGGAGIGAALTEGFIAQGSKVSFVQRSDGKAFCDRMEEKYQNRPHYIKCDISNILELKQAIKDSAVKNGIISILVNNAADDVRHSTIEVTEKFWDKSQAVN